MVTEAFSPAVEHLTWREIEILGLISKGFSNREIAEELVVTPGTVKWYNKQIFRKLGVNSRTKAVVKANKDGIFDRSQAIDEIPRVAYEHNLPAPLTSFIGRESEINKIKQLLGKNRLLTITGPGGSGKSRLALQVAGEAIEYSAGGVFVIDLAPLGDADLVLNAIAGTLGIREIPGEPLLDTLKNVLRDKQMLLLLDNFEQIIEAGLIVSELLFACPYLKVLVTSRESLSVYGEQVYIVPPMSTPDPKQLENFTEILNFESVQLFYQRAKAVKPDFIVDETNLADIAEICVRLDGLPLAIELAAARSNLFTPEMIRSHLDNRFSILTGGSRNVPQRQQTLKGTLDWSFNLLKPGEQILLGRLSVFQGGRTVESSEVICGPGLPIDVLDGLETLLDKNLLYQEQSKLGEPRFYMLETIHEYAREKLEDSREAGEVKLRHIQYFTDLAQEAEEGLFGPRQAYWFDKLRLEYDNLRAAMKRSLNGAGVLLGSQIIASLRYFWYSDGLIAEGFNWIEVAQDNEKDIPTDIQAKVNIAAAELSFAQGHQKKVEICGRNAYELAQKSGDQLTLGWALITKAKIYYMPEEQDIPKSIMLCKESLAIFRKMGYLPGISIALNLMGETFRVSGDYETAEEYYRECIEVCRRAGDSKRMAASLSNLASVVFHHGDFQEAEQLQKEAIRIEVELGTNHYVGLYLACLSGILAMRGNPKQAAVILGASESILQNMGAKLQPTDQIEVEQYLVPIKEQLDEKTFEDAMAEGRELSLEEAVSYALEEQAD
jgi:predicted ATPase/DNA-binding CsgD family transcriptional regulator